MSHRSDPTDPDPDSPAGLAARFTRRAELIVLAQATHRALDAVCEAFSHHGHGSSAAATDDQRADMVQADMEAKRAVDSIRDIAGALSDCQSADWQTVRENLGLITWRGAKVDEALEALDRIAHDLERLAMVVPSDTPSLSDRILALLVIKGVVRLSNLRATDATGTASVALTHDEAAHLARFARSVR